MLKDIDSNLMFSFVYACTYFTYVCLSVCLFVYVCMNAYVTGPAKHNHVSANYTLSYIFANIFSVTWYPISVSFRRKPIKFCSVTGILLCYYK